VWCWFWLGFGLGGGFLCCVFWVLRRKVLGVVFIGVGLDVVFLGLRGRSWDRPKKLTPREAVHPHALSQKAKTTDLRKRRGRQASGYRAVLECDLPGFQERKSFCRGRDLGGSQRKGQGRRLRCFDFTRGVCGRQFDSTFLKMLKGSGRKKGNPRLQKVAREAKLVT